MDEDLARKQVAVFAADARLSRLVTLEEWKSRPWHEKLGEWVASLVRPQS